MPANATAKVDFRLVPNQDPDDIRAKLRAHLDANGFDDIAISVTGGYFPAKIDPDDPFVQIAAEAATEAFGVEAVIEPILGVSGPMSWFTANLPGMPIVTAGAGYPGGKVHAPNEHVKIDLFVSAIKQTARIIGRFGTS